MLARLRSAAFSAGLALAMLAVAPTLLAETTHTVAPGQTLGKIAKRYGVTVEALEAANDLPHGQAIHPGLELVIPEKGKLGAPHATKTPDPGARGAKGDAYARRPKRPGVVHLVRGEDRFDGQLIGRHGKLNPPALEGIGKILQFYPTGAKTSIDPRLAALIAMLSDHFGGRTIHVVSGFRPYSPKQYTAHSNHNVGRAMDFNVEGVPNTVVRDACREFQNAGVGYYPNSSFVHLDVRSGRAYWIDYARPGEAPHYDKPGPNPEADDVDTQPSAAPPVEPVDPQNGSPLTP